MIHGELFRSCTGCLAVAAGGGGAPRPGVTCAPQPLRMAGAYCAAAPPIFTQKSLVTPPMCSASTMPRRRESDAPRSSARLESCPARRPSLARTRVFKGSALTSPFARQGWLLHSLHRPAGRCHGFGVHNPSPRPPTGLRRTRPCPTESLGCSPLALGVNPVCTGQYSKDTFRDVKKPGSIRCPPRLCPRAPRVRASRLVARLSDRGD